MCTVVVDDSDHIVLWLAPSQRVRDPEHALARSGFTAASQTAREATWWTEVIRPAVAQTGAEPVVDAGSVAVALAREACGEAQRLGAPAGRSEMVIASEPNEDLACDVLTDSCAIYVVARSVLAVTPWVSIALAWAALRGVAPVFVTPSTTQLSPVMHHFARRGGCLWVRQGAEGMYNGATGGALEFYRGEFVDSPAPPWPGSATGEWELVYEGETLHTDVAGMQIGNLAQATLAACGMEPPTSWGVLEPTSEEWHVADLTEHARQASPEPSRLFIRCPNTDGIITVVPQPVGVHESVMWTAPALEVMPRSTNLGRLGEGLLAAGSDVVLLGYRAPVLTTSGAAGTAGNLVPGVICFKPARFGGLGVEQLDLPIDSGARAYATQDGIVVTFPAPQQISDLASGALLAAWDRTLAALVQRNGGGESRDAFTDSAASDDEAVRSGARA